MLKANPIRASCGDDQSCPRERFYKETLGLRFVSEGEFALVFDAGGIMLRVTPVQELQPRDTQCWDGLYRILREKFARSRNVA